MVGHNSICPEDFGLVLRGEYLGGVHIFVDEGRPKMVLSEDVAVPVAFRAEINAWMDSFFGRTYTVKPGECLMVDGRMFVTRETYNRLKTFDGAHPASVSLV